MVVWQRDEETLTKYPVNLLRNVASQMTITKWSFVLDADLLPNARASVVLAQLKQAEGAYLSGHKVRFQQSMAIAKCTHSHQDL